MGWKNTHVWVEGKKGSSWRAAMKAHNLFPTTCWKTFLLGSSKNAEWKTESKLRGIPNEISIDLENYLERFKGEGSSLGLPERLNNSSTYYSVKELKEIDLDEPIGMPEKINNSKKFKYCVDCKLDVDGSQREVKLNHLDPETIRTAAEKGQKEIEVFYSEKNNRFYPLDAWRREKETKEKWGDEASPLIFDNILPDKPETKNGTLIVERIKRRRYAKKFEEFVQLVEEIEELADISEARVIVYEP